MAPADSPDDIDLPPSVARATSVLFALGVVGGVALLILGFSKTDQPEWGRVLMAWGAAIAFLFVIPLFLRPAVRVNLVITLVTVGAALFAFNIYLLSRGPPHAQILAEAEAARSKQPGYDTRSPIQVARELTAAGQPTVPFLTGRISRRIARPDEVMPLAGVSSSTTALCNEPGPYILYYADEYGFRNPPGLHTQADVIIVGDSFAQGECVPPGKDTAGLLRAKGHKAVSLGASGVGPMVELGIFKEYGLRLKPKVVIWYFFEDNDLDDMHQEAAVPRLGYYLTNDAYSQKLVERQPEIDAFWRNFLANVQPSALTDDKGTRLGGILSLRAVRRLVGLSSDIYWPWEGQFAAVLTKVKALSEAQGAKVHFVFLPGWSRYGTKPRLDKEEVFALVRGLDLPILDFDQVLQETQDPLAHFPSRKFGHYNIQGHALLADAVEKHILTP